MRTITYQLHRVIIIIILLLPLATMAQTNISQTDSQLKKVLTKIKQLKTDLVDAKTRVKYSNTKLKRIDLSVATSAADLTVTQKKLKQQSKLLLNLRKQQATLQHNLTKQRDTLAQQLRHAARLTQHDPMKLLLNKSSISDISRTLTYYRYVNQAHSQRIDQMRSTLSALHNNEKTIQLQTVQLTSLKQKQAKQKNILLVQQQKQQKLLNEIRNQLNTKNKQLNKLDSDKKALTALLKKLRAASNQTDFTTFKRYRGKLPMPTIGRTVVSFNDSLSNQRDLSLHGMIIAAPAGQDVKAIAPGKVVFADWLRGMGLLLIIDHGGGYMSLYGHNQLLTKNSGDVVSQGDAIALVGQSGAQAQPGLYFAIRHNGVAVNPMQWCSGSAYSYAETGRA